jgi:hypothetical protein
MLTDLNMAFGERGVQCPSGMVFGLQRRLSVQTDGDPHSRRRRGRQ